MPIAPHVAARDVTPGAKVRQSTRQIETLVSACIWESTNELELLCLFLVWAHSFSPLPEEAPD